MKKTKGYIRGGKMPMARDKDGEVKPAFLVDGNGMKMGGVVVPKTKGYFKGGKVMEGAYGGLVGHTPRPFPGKRGVGAPPRAERGGKG